jgi:hypothetical protein
MPSTQAPEGFDWSNLDTVEEYQDGQEETGGFTLREAMETTPDDPPAKHQTSKTRAVRGSVRITAKVRKDVEGKVAFFLSMLTMGVQLRDPYCGRVLDEQSLKIAEKATPIICQSPQLVEWFTKAGGYMLWMDLALAVQPVAWMAVQHHLMHTVGDVKEGDGSEPVVSGVRNLRDYTA